MADSLKATILNYFTLRSVLNSFDKEDVAGRNRFLLFRVYTLALLLISLLIISQVIITFHEIDLVSGSIILLNIILIFNYLSLLRHGNIKLAYWIIITSSFLVVHTVTYYSGGIRNSGFIFMGGFILATFMLLGNRAGKIFSVMAIANVIYFYVLTDMGIVNYKPIIIQDTPHDLNLDYFMSFLTGTFLLFALSNYIENDKNIIITKISESRDELQRKNVELERLSLVASKTDNAVIIANYEGDVEWVNDAYTKIMGFSFNETCGKNYFELLHAESGQQDEIHNLIDHINKRKSYTGEIVLAKKSQELIWLSVQMTPVNTSGNQLQYVFVQNDISERKESEERLAEYYRSLEKANKELDKFAYVVSHDLKAPLRAISNLSTWIEEDMGDGLSDDSKQHFNMIKGRVMRLEALINGILEYSRADRVKGTESLTNVRQLLEEVYEMLVLEQKVELNLPSNLPEFVTDKLKLHQVFSNLISNAIKHCDKEYPIINISCKEDNENYEFSIEDNGPGIESQFHEKIFVIFQTLLARDVMESTGVGLAIVKKIIDERGGKIWVESEMGIGTKFCFIWPKKAKTVMKDKESGLEEFQQSVL